MDRKSQNMGHSIHSEEYREDYRVKQRLWTVGEVKVEEESEGWITPAKSKDDQQQLHQTRSTLNKENEELLMNNKPKSKKPWSLNEDDELRRLVSKYGARDWSFIAEHFWVRGGKQCRERWHNHLRNGVVKTEWSFEEEWILALAVKGYGNKWSWISQFIPGRSDNNIKNHWNCKMKPKKGFFDQRIKNLMESELEEASFSKIELQLFSKIKERDNVTWQSQDIRRNNMKQRCKAALLDFYKLQARIQEGGFAQIKGEIFEHYEME